MQTIMDMSKESFSIGFKGENNIDLKDLLHSLDGTVELIDFVSNSLDKESFTKINVQGTRTGSFIIDFCFLAREGLGLFNTENITYAKLCLDTVCALFNLKKHLKGKKAKSVASTEAGKVTIENVDSEKLVINTYIYNMYGSESNQSMKRIFSECKRDGFYIENKGKKIVEIDKSEFSNMGKDIDSLLEETVTTTTARLMVGIKKADFVGESKWELIYNNKVLKASIKDIDFKEALHNGSISITGKTCMEIELLTEAHLNEIGEVVKTAHYINKVLNITDSEEVEQIELECDKLF